MTLDFGFEVKSLSDAGQFAGLASTYGNLDLGGDKVMPGAFTATLAKANTRPVLWAHMPDQPIGVGTLSDTPAGLSIAGKLVMDVVKGKEAYSLLKAQAVRGLSIGYSVPQGGASIENGIRTLKQIDLHEVSLVAVPMNPAAQVTSVKSQVASIRDYESMLHQCGWSRSEAKALAGHGWAGLGIPEEPKPDHGETELLEWLRAQNQRFARRY